MKPNARGTLSLELLLLIVFLLLGLPIVVHVLATESRSTAQFIQREQKKELAQGLVDALVQNAPNGYGLGATEIDYQTKRAIPNTLTMVRAPNLPPPFFVHQIQLQTNAMQTLFQSNQTPSACENARRLVHHQNELGILSVSVCE